MGADVPSLMIAVDREVEPEKFGELGIVEAQHGGEVSRPVLVLSDAAHLTVTIQVPVDDSSYSWQLGYQIH